MGKGYVQVYTGDGKGKTTAALGLAVRAVGAGLRVYIGQFIKDFPYNEIQALRSGFPSMVIEQYGKGCGFVLDNEDKTGHIAAAEEGLNAARAALTGGRYDMVILDEINIAAHLGLIAAADILSMMAQKPEAVELILTGRNVNREIIEGADLVTEMREIKHYYSRGVEARDGIER